MIRRELLFVCDNFKICCVIMTYQDQPLTRIDQATLDKVAKKHAMFRAARIGGVCADLSHHNLSGVLLSGGDWAHANFSHADLSGADLSQIVLDYAVLCNADLGKSNLSKSSLMRADLKGCRMEGVNMRGADLSGADLREDNGRHADLSSACMRGAILSGISAERLIARDADLRDAWLVRADLREADLAYSDFSGSTLTQTFFRGANMRGVAVYDVEIDLADLHSVDTKRMLGYEPNGLAVKDIPLPLDELLRRHDLWTETGGNDGDRLDLGGFDLRGVNVNLDGAFLAMMTAVGVVVCDLEATNVQAQASDLRNADMRRVNMSGSDFRGVNLMGAWLNRADLRRCRFDPLAVGAGGNMPSNLSHSCLRHADLRGSNLIKVDFSNADLSYADLTGCIIDRAVFTGANLKGVVADQELIQS